MNAFMKITEVGLQECVLAKLAKKLENKSMDIKELDRPINVNDLAERRGLNDDEKKQIKDETGWSDEVIDHIASMNEYNIYKLAGLQEAEIGGKKCLIRTDIDMDQKDEFGRTNKERMENGQPPITRDGETIELHHIGQRADSPLAELTTQEHRGAGNDTVLHDKQKESEIDRGEFKKEREAHWESRVEE